MKKIPSFTINHLTLNPGVYVSRKDVFNAGECVTTFDLRFTAPNREPALSISALHAMEHLAATYLRNDPEWGEKVVYWGPMGCCTGNYLLLKGEPSAEDVRRLMIRLMEFIIDYKDEIPGASPRDCGNYLLMSLPEAKMAAKKYLAVLRSDTCGLEYDREETSEI